MEPRHVFDFRPVSELGCQPKIPKVDFPISYGVEPRQESFVGLIFELGHPLERPKADLLTSKRPGAGSDVLPGLQQGQEKMSKSDLSSSIFMDDKDV
ncbi:hypothetical protein LWI29_036247 [Acer saccharum]|uniref:Uncharacterized protein n=1 Tax=Acer saccharum TaxID=4024 RepID=A0AA39SA95_ACESA|nr:hypothetical protein LWI29_036247 [Acer saccharum]